MSSKPLHEIISQSMLNLQTLKKRMKRVKPIEKNKKGDIVINLDSDAGNADWLRAARLLKKGKTEALKKLHDTPMYKIDEDK